MPNSFPTQWTVAHQAPLSMGFPRQEYWNELPFPSPGNLPDLRIKPMPPALAGKFFTTEPGGKPITEIQRGKIVQKRLQNCRNKTVCVLESCELFFHFVTNFKKWQHIIHMPFYGSPVDKANIKSCIPSQR